MRRPCALTLLAAALQALPCGVALAQGGPGPAEAASGPVVDHAERARRAAPADLADRPGCRVALAELGRAERAALAVADLRRLRRLAARACLGEAAPDAAASQPRVVRVPAPPSAAVTPTPALPSRAPTAAPPPAPSPVPSPAPSPARPPPAIASCDATGCWTTDGTRLMRIGPNLQSPRGPCTQVGALLQCP